MMWKWIKEHAQPLTVTILGIGLLVTVFGLLPNMFFWTVESEVNGQILAKVQPQVVALSEKSARHDVYIEDIKTDLQEIKNSINALSQKFTSFHNFLIPMRDAIVDVQRDVKELQQDVKELKER